MVEIVDVKEHYKTLENVKGITPAHIEFFRYIVAGIEICFGVTIEEILKEGKYGDAGVYDARRIAIATFDEQFHLKDALTGLIFKKDRSTIIHSLKLHQSFMDAPNEYEYKEKTERFKLFMSKEVSIDTEKEVFSKKEVLEILRFNGVKYPLFHIYPKNLPTK